MSPYPNLISESLLINETVALLKGFGGSASAVSIVDLVMKIRRPDPMLARLLVSDLIARDPRFVMNGDMVDLIDDRFESRELADTDFVVFDLETTGSQTPECRVIEIGAYRVRNSEIVAEFHTLVNPEMPIPEFISRLTGIDDGMVREAPAFREIVADLLEFIGNAVLVAHNSGFDMRFLNFEISRLFDGYRIANPCLCTVQLSRNLLPEMTNHKLKTLAAHYSVELVNHHRAHYDARATAHIFINLLTSLNSRGVSNLAAIWKIGSRRSQNYAK